MLLKRLEQCLIILTLIGQLCCQGWYFPGISAYPAYLLCLLALSVVSVFNLIYQTNGIITVKSGLVPLSVLTIINVLVVSFISGRIDVGRIMLITCSFMFCFACTQAFNTKEEMEKLLKWYIAIVFVSALVEIGQVYNVEFCTELWESLHQIGNELHQAVKYGRYLGLAGDALAFAYHVSAALAIVLFIKFKKANSLIKLVLLGVFIFALTTNATRSGIVAFFVAFAIWAIAKSRQSGVMEKVWKALGVLATLLILVTLFVDSSVLFEGTRFEAQDSGTMARIPMITTAFNHALHYPFGMGIYVVQPGLIVGTTSNSYAYVLNNTAHNLLGNCVASYGFIGLGLLVGIYIWAIKTYQRKKAIANDPRIYMIALSGLVGLAVNAFFHNSYILNGELSSFMFFAVMCTACYDIKTDNLAENGGLE